MNINWEYTDKRFVALFDIMGFKDMVQRETHDQILKKLESLKKVLLRLEQAGETIEVFKKHNVPKNQTRSVTFSDTIIIFSAGDSLADFQKIIIDSLMILKICLKHKIGIKGALSYGEITVDFDKNLFFGQPIIDAHLLHENLLLYSGILDNSIEKKYTIFGNLELPKDLIVEYKVPLKTGTVTHKLINYPGTMSDQAIIELKKLYETVSSKPRQYIDNTIDFLNTFK